MATVIGGILACVFTGLSIAWEGYVGMILWRWFAAPILHLPAITLTQAIGLSLVASAFWPRPYPLDTEDDPWTKAAARAFVHGFAAPAVLLLIGWAIK